ncbi:MAG: phosphate starvation-inducible protein PsiF [Afipia sp.]|nr:phosphate starvation-inducible protein PsiF [Afipia sp.]
MKLFSTPTIAAAVASFVLIGSAVAQTTATPSTTTTKSQPAEKKAEKPRTAESIECSKEADAKGLHGKERKKFRSECKKNAKGDSKAN